MESLRLEFTCGISKCPLCQMHFARCNRMNEEQRRNKTAARIREIGRRNTDLSFELNEPINKSSRSLRNLSKEQGMGAVELQKKLANMAKKAKVEQAKWKEQRASAQPPHPFYQEEMDSWEIKMSVAGHIAFRGIFPSWLQDEYRYNNRVPLRYWIDWACKGENCSTCAYCPRCRIGLHGRTLGEKL